MKAFGIKKAYRTLFRDQSKESPLLEPRIETHIEGMQKLSTIVSLTFWPLMVLLGFVAKLPDARHLIMAFAALGSASAFIIFGRKGKIVRIVTWFFFLAFPGVIAYYIRASFINIRVAATAFSIVQDGQIYYHIQHDDLFNIVGLFDRLLSVNFFYALSLLFTILIPTKFKYIPNVLVVYAFYGYYAFSLQPSAYWISIYLLVLFIGTTIKAIAEGLIVDAARQQLDQEERFKEMTRAVLERDLELARDIQLSIAIPEKLETENLEINFFLRAHHKVGGDWVALRQEEDGSYYILLTDAVGKGLQASLIVHAVQSLWTAAEPHVFDPEAWVRLVNDTLCKMGQKSPHCITLGLIHLASDRITYWSAAHCPILVSYTDRDIQSYSEVNGQGNMVGISNKMEMVSKTIELKNYDEAHCILCSDGLLSVIPRGVKRMMLMKEMERDFAETLKKLEPDDDLTVVSIKYKNPNSKRRVA